MKLNPLTIKRWRRFKSLKRAYLSFWLLAGLYLLCLGAELICNSNPLWVRYNGVSYFPAFRFYPDNQFTGSGKFTRPDYKQIAQSDHFLQNPDNRMLFALIPYGPLESIPSEAIQLPDHVSIELHPLPLIGSLALQPDYTIVQASSCSCFFGRADAQLIGAKLTDFWPLPEAFQQALASRFANRPAAALTLNASLNEARKTRLSLATFQPRSSAPQTVRLILREPDVSHLGRETITWQRHQPADTKASQLWNALPPNDQKALLDMAWLRFNEPVADTNLMLAGRCILASFTRPNIIYPLRPLAGHPLGIDSAGRDVLARILYGLRISLTFGFLLVLVTMAIGISIGALQGYYGGALDILGQRFIEIWDALPFLYILILMGSVFGRSFGLLLTCYGIFNWVGISYYQRAEFLRLRKTAFVEAAQCQGLRPLTIMFRHMLPNALVPVITFFPFSLVGAIGLLAALDYLGFGLPPPTPSLGELLTQAQEYNWAWWLTLYPSLTLFIIMLMGVFVGEGARNAFDPRPISRLE